MPAITATGTPSNTVTFQKSGAGANPIINPGGTSATTDFGIALTGADYYTFDGIDINASTAANVEYGYLIRNVTATNGAQNNTIQNMAITMNTTGANAIYGILQATTAAGGGITPTATTGANNTNRYLNFTINSTKGAAIYLLGTAAFPDANCEIGTTACATTNSIGAVATAVTGLTAPIRTMSQNSLKIYNNIIQPITLSSAGVVDGIFMDNAQGSPVSIGTCEIYNNRILGLNNTNTGAGILSGIRMNLTATATSVARVYNNWVTGLESANTSTIANPARIIGIRIQDAGNGTGSIYNIDFNNVRIASTNLATTSTCLSSEGAGATGPIVRVRNNVFANFTGAQTGLGKHFIVSVAGATTVGPAGSTWNYNDYYLDNTTNGFIGRGGATDFATLAAWQAGPGASPAGTDANTIQVNPQYTSATDLHVSAAALNAAASPTATADSPWVTADIDCQTRPQPAATNYDIGADEIVLCSGTPTAGTISTPTNPVCGGTSPVLTLTGASTGGGINYQWRSSTTPGGPYSNIGGATNSTYTATNVATTTYYVVDVTCSTGPTTVTTAEFTLNVNPAPPASVTPANAFICTGATSVSLTASGGTTYSWSPATGLSSTTTATVTASPTANTTYTVTVSDAIGCTATATALVTLAPTIFTSTSATPTTVCSGGSSQLQATAATTAAYNLSTITPAVIAVPGAGVTAGPTGDDALSAALPLPFTFNFFGANYSQFYISTNGYITLGTVPISNTYAQILPNATVPNNVIALCWSDLHVYALGGGLTRYFTTGTAPNRVFVVNFTNVSFYYKFKYAYDHR